MNQRVQVRVSGHVQGVGYRYFAIHVARQLGIFGTVQNTRDCGVEVIAEGPSTALEGFIEELKRGPHSAQVTDLITAWSEATGDYNDFIII